MKVQKICVEDKSIKVRDVYFIQGESLVDFIYFSLDSWEYNGIDLTPLSFTLTSLVGDTQAVQILRKVNDTLLWTVTDDFTAVDGLMSLEIKGVSSSGEEIIKFKGKNCLRVGKSLKGENYPTPDIAEELLTQVEQIVAGIESGGVIFKTYQDFPSVGDSSKLYIATDEKAVYMFDNDTITYVCIGRDYSEVNEINCMI